MKSLTKDLFPLKIFLKTLKKLYFYFVKSRLNLNLTQLFIFIRNQLYFLEQNSFFIFFINLSPSKHLLKKILLSLAFFNVTCLIIVEQSHVIPFLFDAMLHI